MTLNGMGAGMNGTGDLPPMKESVLRIMDGHNTVLNEYIRLRRDGRNDECAAIGIDLNAQIEREAACIKAIEASLSAMGLDVDAWTKEFVASAQMRLKPMP
jgi:hypothetical protein